MGVTAQAVSRLSAERLSEERMTEKNRATTVKGASF